MASLAYKNKAAEKELPIFVWEGINKSGVKIRGENQAANENFLRAALRRQGITPKKVTKKRKGLSGKALKSADIAQFARQLTTMMRAGVPMLQSLELIGAGHEKPAMQELVKSITKEIEGVPLVESMDAVAGSTGNILYYDATMQMKEDTAKGVQLHTAMLTTQQFPSMVVQMTKIGEESGRLEEMLDKVADYFEEQVDDLVDTLSKQIEPIIMAVLGVLVGGLIIAMYLPIFKLGAVVG
ncbi:Type 4 fimbrial assembly protein PilC [Nymphon striatum]|nr:Type 4 fimbrial assembly protein PilC [Nymphon striatum]